MDDLSRANARRARRASALFVLVPVAVGLVAGLVAGLIAGAVAVGAVLGLVVGLVIGLSATWWLTTRGPAAVLRASGARPLDDAPRLENLLDGLCLSAGVERPELYVVDGARPDVAVVGRDARRATLVVTSGLLDDLDRIELEGVLAHVVVRLRHDDVTPATLVAALGPIGRRLAPWLLDDERVRRADVEAVQLTRYPPGLARALEKIGAVDDEMTHAATSVPAHLWFAPPRGDRSHESHPPLDERIALLREL